jgi:hypothetical protein
LAANVSGIGAQGTTEPLSLKISASTRKALLEDEPGKYNILTTRMDPP